MENQFTHIDANGNAVMVEVGSKEITARSATAVGGHINRGGSGW